MKLKAGLLPLQWCPPITLVTTTPDIRARHCRAQIDTNALDFSPGKTFDTFKTLNTFDTFNTFGANGKLKKRVNCIDPKIHKTILLWVFPFCDMFTQ